MSIVDLTQKLCGVQMRQQILFDRDRAVARAGPENPIPPRMVAQLRNDLMVQEQLQSIFQEGIAGLGVAANDAAAPEAA